MLHLSICIACYGLMLQAFLLALSPVPSLSHVLFTLLSFSPSPCHAGHPEPTSATTSNITPIIQPIIKTSSFELEQCLGLL